MLERDVAGAGMVEFVRVLKELPGYSGWVVAEAEQDPKIAKQSNYAKLGYTNLSGFLAKARLV